MQITKTVTAIIIVISLFVVRH